MPVPSAAPIRLPRWPAAAEGGPDFAAIRAEFDVPEEFPADVLAEAERRAAEPPLPELDATDVPLVTLDPVGSRDLDQAVHLAARGDGYRVSYAIADVGAFVALGGAIDAEARRRGQTLYSPDRRTPLHPPVLSEGAASLLADQLRPAVLWTIDLDADGEPVRVDLRRARVRSRAQLDYPAVQAQADAGTLPEPLALLPEIGALLQRRAAERGAIELGTPDQEVVAGAGRRLDPGAARRPARRGLERRRSRCSPAAAPPALMLDGGVGVLRTLPPARPEDVARLRLLAPALGRRLAGRRRARRGHRRPGRRPAPGTRPSSRRRSTLLRGAAYTPFDGAPPEQPAHSGVARALRARHRAAAPAGRPLRHRGLPRAGRRPGARRPSCGRRCPSCRA